MLNSLIDFKILVDRHMITIIILSLIATALCLNFDFKANLPISFIGIAIVFPIVFSINAAYKRRENALKNFSEFKGNMISLLYARRDWVQSSNESQEFLNTYKETITKLNEYLDSHFTNPTDQKLENIYKTFSTISKSHERMRLAGVPISEISRANQYLSKMIICFEQMQDILQYRTPITIRAYSKVFLNISPILFAPFFASIDSGSSILINYLIAILYSVVLVSLDNIQEHLENPFDNIGVDDISLKISNIYMEIFNDD